MGRRNTSDLEEKLARARTQRAQYLRIKGYELSSDDPTVWPAGRELLRRVVSEHPNDAFNGESALYDLGTSFHRTGD